MPVKNDLQAFESFESSLVDLWSGRKKPAREVATKTAKLIRQLVQNAVKTSVKETLLQRGMPGEALDWGRLRRTGGGLETAREEGRQFKLRVWSSREMLTSDEAGKRLGISREALNNRRKSGQALALAAGKRGFRYPSWQFEDPLIHTIPEVLSALAHLDPWAQYLFFKQPEPLLDGETPLKMLREAKAADVIRIARLLAVETGA